MENTTIFIIYLLTFLLGTALTLCLIMLINNGLKKFFEDLCQEPQVAAFFIKLTKIILLFGGLGAALKNGYATGDKTNWLTAIWDAANQFKESLERLFILLLIFAIVFFLLYLIAKKMSK